MNRKSKSKKNNKKNVNIVEDDMTSEISDDVMKNIDDESEYENLRNSPIYGGQNEKDDGNDIDDDNDIEDDDDILEDNVEVDDEDKEITIYKEDESDLFEEECLYKYADNRSDDEEEIEEIFDDDYVEVNDIVPKEERITKPFLTKYERVRLIGDRTKQLAGGAKPLIKGAEHLPPTDIAILELEHNIIPLIIERPLPNGRKERWSISELIKL